MVVQSAATPPVGVAALLSAASHDGSDFVTGSCSMDVLHAIGGAPDLEAAQRAAIAVAVGFDVILVVLHDEIVRLNERSLALGIETLALVGVPVLLLAEFGNESDDDYTAGAMWLHKHVRGVLSIDATEHELVAGVRAVASGLTVMEPRLSETLLRSAGSRGRARSATKTAARAPGEAMPLSTREREVLALLAQGLATKNIAHELGISAHTVKAHVESIFAKFGATTRAEAVAIGVRRGAVML